MRICLKCKRVGAGVDRCTDKNYCVIADRGRIIVPVRPSDVLSDRNIEGSLIEMPPVETITSLHGDAAPREPNPYHIPLPPVVSTGPESLATPGGMTGEPAFSTAAPVKPEATSGAVAGSILTEAAGIVEGVRDQQHGRKERSFEAIARVWTAYLTSRQKRYGEIRAHDVAHMMVLMKQQRAEWGTPIRDHYVDAAGYSGIAGELALNHDEDEGA